jgi:glycolate oxidase iron-sulfur subunit
MNAPLLRDLEKCVLCGTCKALCPTYIEDSVEPMSARGRMMLALGLFRGELGPSARLNDMLFSCLLCGMCESTCPAGVEITEAVYSSRQRLARSDKKRRILRAAASFSIKRPLFSFRAARIMRPLAGPFLKGLPFEARLGEAPLRKGLKILKPEGKKTGRAAVFTGCAVNYLMPSLGVSLVNVLLNLRYEVVLPAGEVCCGAPLRALGLEKKARGLALRNMEVFSRLKADAVLSLCPTCTLALRTHYPRLIGKGIENAMDITEFIPDKLNVISPREDSLFYHDPCHLRYGLGVHEKPRSVLRALGGKVEEPEEPGCCGFGVGLTHRDMSLKIAAKANERLRDARAVVTACPGCIMQLSRQRPGVRHIIELIEKATVPEDGPAS